VIKTVSGGNSTRGFGNRLSARWFDPAGDGRYPEVRLSPDSRLFQENRERHDLYGAVDYNGEASQTPHNNLYRSYRAVVA